jgi:hypothetical protein
MKIMKMQTIERQEKGYRQEAQKAVWKLYLRYSIKKSFVYEVEFLGIV